MGLVAAVWRHDERLWIRGLAAAALVLVVFQGSLGGLRVIHNERTLAMVHGFTGPLFFALATAIAVFTSARWRRTGGDAATLAGPNGGSIRRLAVVTCVLAYLQIVLGAVLRHVPVEAEPAAFATAVRFHLLMAGILTLHILLLVWSIGRHFRNVRPLGSLALVLSGLLVGQLVLGAATWIVKYSVPAWAEAWLPIRRSASAIVDGGWLQTHVVTGHVAIGSLILATTLALALYALRLLGRTSTEPAAGVRRWEAAL
jgi:cytochrome c oxidase assembly protein subunit 15